jgi:uncharacterized protein
MSVSVPATRLERLVDAMAHGLLSWRKIILLLSVLVTVGLGASALRTHMDAGFNKLIPQRHDYMAAYLQYANTFSGANRVMVNVRWKGEGDIYNEKFLDTLRQVTDEVFFIPGVNRGQVFSLFTPNVRYIEVTEDGFVGEVVIPSRFIADEAGLAQVRSNVARSGQVGSLVGKDLKSALVRADLLDLDPGTGERLDYSKVAQQLEAIRTKFENQDVEIHIVGFAKVVGEVMDGLLGVMAFFVVAFFITAVMLWAYSRSLGLTALALAVALLPVIWLLGLLPIMGYGIDPMSILVPFLIFSIGVSHAVQMTNAWKYETGQGHSAIEAARLAFRRLAIPGSVALLMNALGFMVIMLIDIPIVHELGVTACLGVSLMIATNKITLPILLSFMKPPAAAPGRPDDSTHRHPRWWALAGLSEARPAMTVVAVTLVLLVVGTMGSRQLLTGDIGSGATELRPESRYNRDNDAIVGNYSIGMDVLSLYVETTGMDDACLHWPLMNAVERFDLTMRGVDGVRSVSSVAGVAKLASAGSNEANPRWAALQRSEAALRTGTRAATNPDLGLADAGCLSLHVQLFLKDHDGATLKHVVREIERFIAADQTPNVRFRLAGGNAGVAAATNEAVEKAEVQMLASLFLAIAVFCLITFRSWRATLCIIVPLGLVTILCNALMAGIGIGLKVATLPVIALGVGVGVDYGIYLFERMQHEMEEYGSSLREAFYQALRQRGTAAVFTAITMSIGVGTWAFSALKFQADMGILLAFLFLVNVLGAIFLLPALAYFLNVGGAFIKRQPAAA